MESFKIYRRHDNDCSLASQGMKSDIKKCKCPLWVHGTENGKRVRKSLKTRAVERGLERLVRMQRETTTDGPKAMPVEDAIKLYLADCKARNLAPASLRNYTARLKPLSDFFPSTFVRSITTESFAEFRAQHPLGKASASTRHALIVLRTFFRFCIDRKWIVENPALKMKMAKAVSKVTPPYTAAEVERMLEACDNLKAQGGRSDKNNRQRARALLLTLLYSGLRISDAVKLRRDEVDLKTGEVHARIMKTQTPYYGKLHRDALAALAALPVESPYFFWSGTCKLRTAIGSASKTISAIGKHAGVAGARPHRFRDTFSVNLLQNGADIRTVQLLLGHTSVVTTEKHYAPFVPGTQRIIDDAVAGLKFGHSRTPRVVDAPNDAFGDTQRNPRRPLPFPKKLASG